MLLARWPVAMTSVRVAGAAYLAWLGLASVYRVARHADGGLGFSSPAGSPVSVDPQRALATPVRQGLTVNLLNPAIATFYLAVVPTFLPDGASGWYFAALAAVHIAMAFVCHGIWAVGLDTLRQLFRPPLARRWLEALTAAALLGLSVRVLLGS
jgi:threonine/homoserine/homoserine lactone efflux protein